MLTAAVFAKRSTTAWEGGEINKRATIFSEVYYNMHSRLTL